MGDITIRQAVIFIFAIIVAAGIIYGMSYLAQLYRDRFVTRKRKMIYINEIGLRILTIEDVDVPSAGPEMGDEEGLPRTFKAFIKKLSYTELADQVTNMVFCEDNVKRKDIRRGITIAAAVYDFAIPPALVLIDERTGKLFRKLKAEMEMYHVHLPVPETFIIQNPEPNPGYYVGLFELVGRCLMRFAQDQYYPHFQAFYTTFVLNHKKHFGSKQMTFEELRSTVTAYAALTDVAVPDCYIQLDDRALSIIKHIKAKKPKLTLITSDQQEPVAEEA